MLTTEEKISTKEWILSAVIAAELEKKPTVIFPTANIVLIKMEIMAILSFI